MSDISLHDRLLHYLEAHNVAVLATTDANGPWAAPVFFANQGFSLYFVSDPKTRHGAGIGTGARVAAAITEDHRKWQAIQGIQLEGICAPVAPDYRDSVAGVFLAKYPFTRAFLDPAGPMYEKAGRKAVFYHLEPDTIWFTDNTRGFGHRERLDLSETRGT